MRLAVAQKAREGRQIDTIRHKIQGLYAGEREPQIRINAPSVDPRVHWSHTCGLPIHADFRLAERGVAAALQLASDVIGYAGIPKLIVRLALRDDVQVRPFDIGWQGKGFGQL